jgi:hypothetical protein
MFIIKNPCPEKWENMTPVASDPDSYRGCDSCCKVVVDFSHCSNEEIIDYFSANSGKRICGRFLNEQVVKPKPKNRIFRFAAAAVFVFGAFLFSSCKNSSEREQHIMGDTVGPDSAMVARNHFQKDSIRIADSLRKIGK